MYKHVHFVDLEKIVNMRILSLSEASIQPRTNFPKLNVIEFIESFASVAASSESSCAARCMLFFRTSLEPSLQIFVSFSERTARKKQI